LPRRRRIVPSLIACKTIIGFGAPKLAGTGPAHGGPYGAEEIAGIRKSLDWPHEPFVIPDEILAAWRKIGKQGARHREAWLKRLRRKRQARRVRERRCRASCRMALALRSTRTRSPLLKARNPTRRANGLARRWKS
jgi:transketolase